MPETVLPPNAAPRTLNLGAGTNLFVGVLASPYISFKPHHALIPVIIETVLVLKHRFPSKFSKINSSL